MNQQKIRGIVARAIPPVISLSLLAGFFVGAKQSSGSIELSPMTISEVHITGGPGKSSEDFIELYNSSDKAADIGNWQLKKRTSTGTESSINKFKSTAIIPAKGYYLWTNSSLSISTDTSTGSTITADNSIALFDESGKIIDSVGWGKCVEKSFQETACFPENPAQTRSLHRVKDTNDNSSDFVLDDPSPQSGNCENTPEENQCIIPTEQTEQPPKEIPRTYSGNIRLNEILPHPVGDEKIGEYIELFNSSSDSVDLFNWTLRDTTKTGKYVFPAGSTLKAKDFRVIYRSEFDFALNNSGDETVTLLNPNNETVSEISYDSADEGVSYNHFDATLWRWSKLLTPGAKNQFNNLPKIDYSIPKNAYPKVYADFSVRINDPDKDKTKVTWNFGDGHKSYIAKTRHKYEALGTYAGSVIVFDGSEEVRKYFSVIVKKFPHPKARIVAIAPNPTGKDSENETITIKNDSKKKINLRGWSIATGKKKLVNHLIKTDFEIKPKKSRVLTREDASFTLPNSKTKLELRYPDGKTAHKIKYDKEKIAEGEVYQRVDGKGWEWKISKSSVTSQQSTGNIPVISQQPLVISSPVENIQEEDIGKFSAEPKRDELLVDYLIPVELPEKARNIILVKETILGASTVRLRLVDSTFAFTASPLPAEHYAIKFGKQIGAQANALLAAWIY